MDQNQDNLYQGLMGNMAGIYKLDSFDPDKANMNNSNFLDDLDFSVVSYQNTGSDIQPTYYGISTMSPTEKTQASNDHIPAECAQRVGTVGLQGARTGGTFLGTPGYDTTAQKTYSNRLPSTVQPQAKPQRGCPRGSGAKSKLVTLDAAGQTRLRSESPFVGAADMKLSTSPLSMDPVTCNTAIPAAVNAQAGSSLDPSSSNSVRPVHLELNHARIENPGQDRHPDRNWRAPGAHQWVEILHDHTLLRYLSTNVIKEILNHCGKLMGKKRVKSGTPSLVENGLYDTTDAGAVWDYCTAYLKRRSQLNNNVAASRSRATKAATLKHWKALALATGVPDIDFECDLDDPGNAPDAEPNLLSAVTQKAIADFNSSLAMMGTTPNPVLPIDQGIFDVATQAAPIDPDMFNKATQSILSSNLANQPSQYQQFRFQEHVLSQQQDLSQLLNYRQPTPASTAPAPVPLPCQTRAQARANARRHVKVSPSEANMQMGLGIASEDFAMFGPSIPAGQAYNTAAAPLNFDPNQNINQNEDLAWIGGWTQTLQGDDQSQGAPPFDAAAMAEEMRKMSSTPYGEDSKGGYTF